MVVYLYFASMRVDSYHSRRAWEPDFGDILAWAQQCAALVIIRLGFSRGAFTVRAGL